MELLLQNNKTKLISTTCQQAGTGPPSQQIRPPLGGST